VANALRLPVAATLLTAAAYGSGRTSVVRKAGRRSVGIVALTGFFGTGIGSTLFLIGVQFAGAAKAAPLSSLSPLFAVPLSAILLGERPTRRVFVGTLLSVAGVWLVL
jgi:drug/metabolite transporter (DMT)-like permease